MVTPKRQESRGYETRPLDRGVGPGDKLLVQLVREGLGLTNSSNLELSESHWEPLRRELAIHRLGGLVWPVLSARPGGVPTEAANWFAGLRDATSRLGAANLLTMRKVIPRMQAADIPALAFKGPVLQQLAYRSIFHRPSTDLDILVPYRDFDRAGRLLVELDFELAPVCRSPWWKLSLGEQHFLTGSASAVTVDLHHRVQQPGCPLPLQPDRFFQQSVAVMIGGQAVPTLSLIHTTLLTAMSYAKALHHREPAARYLVDLIALSKDRPTPHWRDVEAEARLQGLSNTLALAVRASLALLGRDSLPASDLAPVLEDVPDQTLIRMTLSPQDTTIAWPRRRALLHALYDTKSLYPGGFVAMVGSDLLRRLASPIPPGKRVTAAAS